MRAKGGSTETVWPPPAGRHPAMVRVAIAAHPATSRRRPPRVRVPRPARPVLRTAAGALARIQTERLVIRMPTPGDVPGLAQTIDGVVMAANGMTPHHVADILTRTGLSGAGAGPDAGTGLVVRAVIADRTTGEIVGSVGYHWVDLAHRSCELGWWTGPAARGRGYASEAVAAVVPALHAGGLRRVWIGTAPDNAAVRRTVARVGALLVDQGLIPLPDGCIIPSMWFAHDG